MGAIISPCGRYRYLLTRQISTKEGTAVFIMLNPSTADAEEDDPTIRRCKGFAYKWGCGKLLVANLYSYRATKPADLKKAQWPCGPHEAAALYAAIGVGSTRYSMLICAWGTHGGWRDRDREVMDMINKAGHSAMCLGVTDAGYPRHPLYLKGDVKPELYKGRP